MGPRRVPRKWHLDGGKVVIAPQAASMGPRRVPRKWMTDRYEEILDDVLQWGRGVCLGNGRRTIEQAILAVVLQWGRGVCLGNGSS